MTSPASRLPLLSGSDSELETLPDTCPVELSSDLQDQFWMQQALQLAAYAQRQGEVPVGAVIVSQQQRVGWGWNQVIALQDPTAHAEVMALRQAGQVLQNYRLLNTTLYVTLEPCPMCAGALVHARVQRVVYAASDSRVGACGSVFNLCRSSLMNHRVQVVSGLCAQAAQQQLKAFFQARR